MEKNLRNKNLNHKIKEDENESYYINQKDGYNNLNQTLISDDNTGLNKYFTSKSTFYIKIFSFIVILIVIIFTSVDFILSLNHFNKVKVYFYLLEHTSRIKHNILYSKFYITEAVIANDFDGVYIGYADYVEKLGKEGAKKAYIKNIKNLLSILRQEYTNNYTEFKKKESYFPDEFYNYTNNFKLALSTLKNGNAVKEILTFETGANRIPTTVFYVSMISDDNYMINLKDRNTYELMTNLLGPYFIMWGSVNTIIYNYVFDECKQSKFVTALFISTFILSLVFIILFYKLLIQFNKEREKPISLFLIIKNRIFEELKTSAEDFLNELLNKNFGNVDSGEETRIDFQINVNDNDINIIKFNNKNEFNQKNKNEASAISHIIKLTIFFIISLIYMSFKYIYFTSSINNLKRSIVPYNHSFATFCDLLVFINLLKSLLYSDKILTLWENPYSKTRKRMFNTTEEVEIAMMLTYNTTSFLKNNYKDKFYKYLNSDYRELFEDEYISDEMKNKISQGFKPFLMRTIEIFKEDFIKYTTSGEIEERTAYFNKYKKAMISKLINQTHYSELNFMVTDIIEPWFNKMFDLIDDEVNNFIDDAFLVILIVFICFELVIILAYTIYWKNIERKFEMLLKNTIDLINLIPQELKCIISNKLNEL